MPVSGMDVLCGVCERPIGDHTLREWNACTGKATFELPHEMIPEDEADLVQKDIRERFLLDPEAIIADTVVLRGATLSGGGHGLEVKVPALIHEFQIGRMGQTPLPAAKVILLGDVTTMRAYGRLARDTANGVANAAERT